MILTYIKVYLKLKLTINVFKERFTVNCRFKNLGFFISYNTYQNMKGNSNLYHIHFSASAHKSFCTLEYKCITVNFVILIKQNIFIQF